MPKLYFILLLLPLFSCQNSTEHKIRSIVEAKETKTYTDKGENIEVISIDSLTYKTVSMKDALQLESSILQQNYLDALRTHNELQSLNGTDSTSLNNVVDANAKVEYIKKAVKLADTTNNIYRVSYIAKIKTNVESMDYHNEIFISKDSMKQIKLKY